MTEPDQSEGAEGLHADRDEKQLGKGSRHFFLCLRLCVLCPSVSAVLPDCEHTKEQQQQQQQLAYHVLAYCQDHALTQWAATLQHVIDIAPANVSGRGPLAR